MLDAAAAMVGLLVAFLLLGRFGQRRAVSDLVLVYAMLVFAIANLGLSALPSGLIGGSPRGFTVWAPLLARLIGSFAFAVAPYPLPVSPDRTVPWPCCSSRLPSRS